MTLYFAYLDEFGHIGPYVDRNDPRHNTSPIFGLGGMVLPYETVRGFATWFYQLKCSLLDFELRNSNEPPYRWEKKGSALYTTRNVLQYRELRRATFRLLNKITGLAGAVLYVGIEKRRDAERHDSVRIYGTVLREAIKRLDQFSTSRQSKYLLILDEQKEIGFRSSIVAEASRQMFGPNRRTGLIEPPIQAESHLFQTLQCADWLCGLIGRVACHQVAAAEYPDLDWTRRYFETRLRTAAPTSGIRKQSN